MGEERLFTVGELARRCGVTVRTLQFYDRSGLLSPCCHSDGGRRLYGMDDVLRLQQILFFKGLGFPLEEIRDRLLSIHTARDFADALERQRDIVEKQIEYLRGTSGLIDKAIAEIRKNGDVRMEMVVSILSATRQDEFFSIVTSYFEQKKLEALYQASKKLPEQVMPGGEWCSLLMRLKELHEKGADPFGQQGQQLAGDWWDMVMQLTGGDPELLSSLLQMGLDMSDWPQEAGDMRMAIQEFLSPALGAYIVKNGIMLPGMEELGR